MKIRQRIGFIVLIFSCLLAWGFFYPSAAEQVNLVPEGSLPLVVLDPASAPVDAAGSHEETDASLDGENRIRLSMAWWGTKRRHDRTIKVIELFERQHPGISISHEFFFWKEYWTTMENKAIEGRLPDIMQQDYARLNQWVKKGWIVPLDAFVASGILDFRHVLDASISAGRINGALYGVSAGTNAQTIVLDADAFKQAGINLPPAQWSWQDFEQLAIEIHEKTGAWGMGERLISPPLLWQAYLLGHGQWSYAKNGEGVGYTDDLLVDYLKMLLRLQKSGAIPHRAESPYLFSEPEDDVEKRPLVSGKAAMDYMWSNQIVAAWDAAGEGRHFKMMPLPRPRGGNPSCYLKPSMFFSLTPGTRHPREAAMLIDFFTNSLEANEILMADRGVPISFVIRENLLLLLSPAQFEMFVYLSQIEYDNSPTPPPNPPAHGDIVGREYYADFINPVLLGKISPEIAVKNFREKVNTRLRRHSP